MFQGILIERNPRIENGRDAICDYGFEVDTTTLNLDDIDPMFSCMSDYEEEFVNKALEGLKKSPKGLGQTELLKHTGHEKTDKTARDVLEKFTDKFWSKFQERKGAPITYKLK